MQLATVLRQALELWQNPPITVLPEETFLNCANRCISQYQLDLNLTPDAAFETLKSSSLQFASRTARELAVSSIPLLSRIVRIESRASTSTNEDDWTEERVASYDSWNDILERGDDSFITWYGTPPTITLVAPRDVYDYSFRLVYRTLRAKVANLSTDVALPDIYEPVLVYNIALEVGEIIDDHSPEFANRKRAKMPYLLGRLRDAERRVEQWQDSQKDTSPTFRRAFNDRLGVPRIGRRRFTINLP